MSARDGLLKMRDWVEKQLAKGKQPRQERFTLTSLSYCAQEAVGGDTSAILALLRSVAKTESQVKTCDVVSPHGAIFLINRALTQC